MAKTNIEFQQQIINGDLENLSDHLWSSYSIETWKAMLSWDTLKLEQIKACNIKAVVTIIAKITLHVYLRSW